MRLGQVAALRVGTGNASIGVTADTVGIGIAAHAQAKVSRNLFGYIDANARWEDHKRAAYAITGGIGATW